MLEISNLSVKRGYRTIIADLALSIQPGQLVALTGENGAGKSTLLHTLAGTHSFIGQILFDEVPLTAWSASELARRRAVLTQHIQTAFNLSVIDVIAMGRHQIAESRQTCFKRVNEFIQLLALEGLVSRSTHQLSGGELQRVHMARCLAQLDAFGDAHKPALLLLDEPTSALDLRHQHTLMQLVRRFVEQGNAAIVAIHDLNLASLYANRVCLLHDKKVAAFGSPSGVFTASRLESVYHTPMHVSSHPTLHHPMIYSEPKENLYARTRNE
ncbi:heme ABC transporter ATP-binding protein [Alteromonas sp. CYL-A6]|uniref:heme ABC transporter ATP-binding protein n=1 Tax=Alteromonas nitratireducens TaxID=3390813 RepID=UPI0034C34766